jgi:hypothetical protein
VQLLFCCKIFSRMNFCARTRKGLCGCCVAREAALLSHLGSQVEKAAPAGGLLSAAARATAMWLVRAGRTAQSVAPKKEMRMCKLV